MKHVDEKSPPTGPSGSHAKSSPTSPGDKPHPSGGASPKEIEDLRRRLREAEEERDRLKRELAEAREKHLRARADYENLVKRTAKESQDVVHFVRSGLLLRLAGLVESLEALGRELEKASASAVHGYRLVVEEARRLLKDEGVKEIPGKGQPFNYRCHQAVERLETSEATEGTILAVVQRGYQLGDEVLRPALVQVAVRPKGGEAKEPSKAET